MEKILTDNQNGTKKKISIKAEYAPILVRES